jgi:hypothetical protein
MLEHESLMGPFFILCVVLIWILPATLVALHAETKGYSFWGFLLLGCFSSWILSLIIVLNLNDRRKSIPTKPIEPKDELDQLERLGDLHERGVLTREEFETRKAIILEAE